MSLTIRVWIASIAICANAMFAAAQHRPITVAIYDVDRLYDTIDVARTQRFHTTDKGWSGHQYHAKIENIAEVIAAIDAPIVAIIGVESEAIVRDLVVESGLEYCYIYRSLNYYDDLDCALLYYGDVLHVERVATSNYIMRVDAEVDGQSVEIGISRRADKVRSLDRVSLQSIQIVMGKFDHRDLARLGMEDPLESLAKEGGGDTYNDMGWYFNSRIGVATPQGAAYQIGCGVYDIEPLLGREYTHEYSRHRPCYITLSGRPAPTTAGDCECAE